MLKPFAKMKMKMRQVFMAAAVIVTTSAFAPVKDNFSTAEQQQISIATTGLFDRSNTFDINFAVLSEREYCFPLPVGKAKLLPSHIVEITTSKGDAVRAMFDGVVRLSRKVGNMGNVIVIRHDNGMETVYANNAQNLVEVGKHVKSGNTIAIVGEKNGKTYCDFSIMINGGKINPETVLDLNSHRLRKQTLTCKRVGRHVRVSVVSDEKKSKAMVVVPVKRRTITNLDPSDEVVNDNDATFKLNLSNIERSHWAYPLAGSHVISPYGGRRNHSGVDVKTCAGDKILAAFDGVVTRSGWYFGYGKCVVIKHAYGFETLYGHQSKNLVSVGQKVKAGDVVGLTGRTGRATTEHLHFEVLYKGHRVNPAMIFDHANKSLQQSTLTLSANGKLSSQRNLYAQGK